MDGIKVPNGATTRGVGRGMKKHPVQPIIKDSNGVERFRGNAIVEFLLDAGPFDMNMLAAMPFDDEDRAQFAQLIGYSVVGFGELSYVSDEIWARVTAQAEEG